MEAILEGVRFPLGTVVWTRGVIDTVDENGSIDGVTPASLVRRHAQGDWGDVDEEDWETNNKALGLGTRIFSVYRVSPQTTIWIVTEADRSVTTLLLPSEY